MIVRITITKEVFAYIMTNILGIVAAWVGAWVFYGHPILGIAMIVSGFLAIFAAFFMR